MYIISVEIKINLAYDTVKLKHLKASHISITGQNKVYTTRKILIEKFWTCRFFLKRRRKHQNKYLTFTLEYSTSTLTMYLVCAKSSLIL